MSCTALALTHLQRIDDHLAHWAAVRGDEVAFRFLAVGAPVQAITFAELHASARAIAGALAARIAPGEAVLLAYAPSLSFVQAYFACLMAGLVPAPLELPRNRRGAEKLRLVAPVAGARWLLSDTRSLAQLSVRIGGLDQLDLHCFATDACAPADDSAALPAPSPDIPALLQFTSGSTGTPKGVVVTHAQLLANERTIAQAFGHDDDTVVAGWLPFFHDMGLIGNVLQPVFLGRPCILMSPLDFIQSPLRWLQAISDHRATTSGGPNFSYALCTAKVPEAALDTLDLSRWRLAFNGAEPVRSEVMRAFAERFARCGFDAKAFYPCYGLAEATLFVSGAHWRPDSGAERTPVSCGHAGAGVRLIVADPVTGAPRREGDVGEIWVGGASVASGYWHDPTASAQHFGGASPAHPGERWLRTGDLGFLRDGELHPTGRLKDLIIVRGANHYPDDIEATVRTAWPGLDGSTVASFSVEAEDDPALVIALEFGRGRLDAPVAAELAHAIRAAVAAEHGLSVASTIVVPVGALPRTSSGKLRRGACRDRFTAGDWNAARLEAREAAPQTFNESHPRERISS